MAQYTAYANYVIYFSDEGEYNFAVSIAGSPVVEISPGDAAGIFGFVDGVNFNTGGPINPERGMYTVSQYALADPGTEILHPGASGIFMSMNVSSRLVPGQAGNPASIFPAGPDLLLVWSATITYMPINPGINPGDRAPIPVRRWYSGFEYSVSEVAQSGGTFNRTRDASRTVEGVGWALRYQNNTNIVKRLDQFATGYTSKKSWERVYMRVRKFGSNSMEFWKSTSSIVTNAGIRLFINTLGGIDIFNVTTNPGTQIGTIAGVFTQDVWRRLDIIIEYNPEVSAGNGGIRIWINGVLEFLATPVPGDGGIGLNGQFHASTILGTNLATASGWEVDFDDWHNAAVPELLGVETLNSYDWLMGTHGRAYRINAGTITGWTGQVQALNQMVNPGSTTSGTLLSSTTAQARIIALTNLTDLPDGGGLILSPASVTVTVFSNLASGSTGGRLGLSFAGSAAVFIPIDPITESTLQSPRNAMFPADGVSILYPSYVPLSAIYEKANTGVQANVYALSVLVEQIGIFGPEDDPSGLVQYNPSRHNAWYPSIAAAFAGPTADGPVVAYGGTYVGNGTTNTIALPIPAHFIYIRPVASANEGTIWFGSSLGGNRADFSEAIRPEQIVRVDYDAVSGVSSFTVLGTNVECNAVGVTYQFIIFCDPGNQYLLTGAYIHNSTLASATNLLADTSFFPAAGMFLPEAPNGVNTTRLGYKGPAGGLSAGNEVDGTDLPDFVTLQPGSFISGADAHLAQFQASYALWRTGNNCESVMCQIYSYTGDGTGTRTINSTPASGRFPLFVYVQPRNAAGFIKDPSDVTTSSRNITNGSASSSAITGVGNDTIEVGSTLNALGIEYNVFIIPGDTAGFNNGLYFPGNCLPDESFAPPEPPLPGIHVLSQGGLQLNGQVPVTLLQDVSGIYTLVKGKRNDTLYDRQSGQPNVDVAIPNPRWKGGYVGG